MLIVLPALMRCQGKADITAITVNVSRQCSTERFSCDMALLWIAVVQDTNIDVIE